MRSKESLNIQNNNMQILIGIDLGGTKCAISIGKLDAGNAITIIDKAVYQTAAHSRPDQMIPILLEGLETLIGKNGFVKTNITSIGISCGGPLDSLQGLILSPPNLPGWDAVPIVRLFQDKFNVHVTLQNDANACALAEWKFGAGKGFKNIVFLTFGTGLGAGLILNGELYSGTNDMAGEVGHIRLENYGPVGYGKSGSFEGFCSGSGIAQLAQIKVRERFQMGQPVSFCKNMSDIDSITAHSVSNAALIGDPLANEIFQICGKYLGKGISILIDILNPELVIIGSIYARAEKLLSDSIEMEICKEALFISKKVCRIVSSKLGESIGDYAALSVAYYNKTPN